MSLHRTPRMLLELLAEGETGTSALAREIGVSGTQVRKHLRDLETRRLTERRPSAQGGDLWSLTPEPEEPEEPEELEERGGEMSRLDYARRLVEIEEAIAGLERERAAVVGRLG